MEIYDRIKELSDSYEITLRGKIDERRNEMENDENGHYLIYGVLGIDENEGKLIDVYQNAGRFLYKYAGAFAEKCAKMCFEERFGAENAMTTYVPNPVPNTSPKQFEIDCLVNETYAYEIKWRDATTDGDHISKEHRRLIAAKTHGYTPVRLMFFPPNRTQAIRIQNKLKSVYEENEGLYFSGEAAWSHIHEVTGINLKDILIDILNNKL